MPHEVLVKDTMRYFYVNSYLTCLLEFIRVNLFSLVCYISLKDKNPVILKLTPSPFRAQLLINSELNLVFSWTP